MRKAGKYESRSQRHEVEHHAGYSVGRNDGFGTLTNLSHTGALLSGTTSKPESGATLLLHILRMDAAQIDLEAIVVRHSADGFAVKFASLTQELALHLDDLEKEKKRAAALADRERTRR